MGDRAKVRLRSGTWSDGDRQPETAGRQVQIITQIDPFRHAPVLEIVAQLVLGPVERVHDCHTQTTPGLEDPCGFLLVPLLSLEHAGNECALRLGQRRHVLA